MTEYNKFSDIPMIDSYVILNLDLGEAKKDRWVKDYIAYKKCSILHFIKKLFKGSRKK